MKKALLSVVAASQLASVAAADIKANFNNDMINRTVKYTNTVRKNFTKISREQKLSEGFYSQLVQTQKNNAEYFPAFLDLLKKNYETWKYDETIDAHYIISRVYNFQILKITDYKIAQNLLRKNHKLNKELTSLIKETEKFATSIKNYYEEITMLMDTYTWGENFISDNKEVLSALA